MSGESNLCWLLPIHFDSTLILLIRRDTNDDDVDDDDDDNDDDEAKIFQWKYLMKNVDNDIYRGSFFSPNK